jgi:hypothetical protein
MMRFSALPCAFVLCLGVSVGWAQAAVTEDTFLLHNTGDLVDLCSAAQSDPLYTPAVNFCHGFGVGVFRVLQEEDMAKLSRHMFCLPNPGPTRNETVANFIQWAKADPGRSALQPADAIATFLAQQFPCPRGR